MEKKVSIVLKGEEGFLEGQYTEQELELAYLALRSEMIKDSSKYLRLTLESENQMVVEGTLVEDELVVALKAVMALIARELVKPEDLVPLTLDAAMQILGSDETGDVDGVDYRAFGEVDLKGLS